MTREGDWMQFEFQRDKIPYRVFWFHEERSIHFGERHVSQHFLLGMMRNCKRPDQNIKTFFIPRSSDGSTCLASVKSFDSVFSSGTTSSLS